MSSAILIVLSVYTPGIMGELIRRSGFLPPALFLSRPPLFVVGYFISPNLRGGNLFLLIYILRLLYESTYSPMAQNVSAQFLTQMGHFIT